MLQGHRDSATLRRVTEEILSASERVGDRRAVLWFGEN
jgi:hypothetical protein